MTKTTEIYPDTHAGRMAWVNAVLALATHVESMTWDDEGSDPDLAQAVSRVYFHAFDPDRALDAAEALVKELEAYVEPEDMPVIDTREPSWA